MKRRHLPSFRYAIRSRSLRNQKQATKSTYFRPIWGLTRKGEYHLLGTSNYGMYSGPMRPHLHEQIAGVLESFARLGMAEQIKIRYFRVSPWTAISMLQAGELTVQQLCAADGWAKMLHIEGIFGAKGPTLVIDRDEIHGTLIIQTLGSGWRYSEVHFYPTLEEQLSQIEKTLAISNAQLQEV